MCPSTAKQLIERLQSGKWHFYIYINYWKPQSDDLLHYKLFCNIILEKNYVRKS